MAAVKGDVGKIMFENAGGTEADISGLRSWSLSITKDTQETTVLGNTSKSFVGGLISGEGSAELIYDPSGNSDYQAFIDDVLTTGGSMDYFADQYFRNRRPHHYFGWVVFARTQPKEWIKALFQMPV